MPAAFAQLRLGTVTTRTAGVGFTLVVTASDQYGNVVPNFNGVISLTDSTKTLMPATWSVWSSGVATPFITITRALANDRITATVSATPTIWITSNLFAVLPNVPASIALQVNPVAIPRGGTAQLTATVQDAYTNPVANGTPVVFTTTAGLLPSQQLTYTAATASGVARAVLTSTCTVQAVTLSAQAGTAVTQTNANFAAPGVAAFVTLTLQSQVLPVGGTTTVLSTTVRDCANSPVTNTTSVAFQVAPISAAIAPNPALTLGGTATATLTSPTVAGSSIITASSGSVRNSQLITFTPLSPYTVTVSPSRSVITPTESTNVNVQVTDRYGNAVANGTPVTFTWTLGTLWPSVVSISNGWASTVFTANGTEGSAVITATAGLGAHGVTTITVSLGRTLIYLPLVLRDYRSGKNLVVSAINSSTNPANVSVVVRNTGDVAVTEAFWVILYLDPTSQVQINKFWWDVGCPLVGGAAWQVTTPVAPGQSMTLLPANATPPYQGYWPASFTAGQHRLWAQVDAYATSGTTGLVQETNESDNIAGPVTFNVP
jgi:hypothetical protein